MELITGLVLGVVGNLVTVQLQDNGKKRKASFQRGKYTQRELESYKGKTVDIEFEWGDSEKRKLIRISIPGPTIRLG